MKHQKWAYGWKWLIYVNPRKYPIRILITLQPGCILESRHDICLYSIACTLLVPSVNFNINILLGLGSHWKYDKKNIILRRSIKISGKRLAPFLKILVNTMVTVSALWKYTCNMYLMLPRWTVSQIKGLYILFCQWTDFFLSDYRDLKFWAPTHSWHRKMHPRRIQLCSENTWVDWIVNSSSFLWVTGNINAIIN